MVNPRLSGTGEPGVEGVKGACKGEEGLVEGKAADVSTQRSLLSEENNFSESLAPNQFELINKLRGFRKPRGAWFFFAASAAKF